jgi:hypothetical protein
MRRSIGGALLVIAGLGLSLLTGPASAVVPLESPQHTNQVSPAFKQDFLPTCVTLEDMNCIESLEYQLDGQWKTAVLTEGGWPGGHLYNTPGLTHESGASQVFAYLNERDDINGPPYAAYQLVLQAWPQDSVAWDPPIPKCEGGDPSKPTGTDPCWRAPWLADAPYRMTVRSSTLIPIFLLASVTDAATSVEQITGGLRISLAGRPGPSQWALTRETAEKNDQFDAVTREWGGFFSDARARGSLAACQGLGMTTAYSNGNGGRMPEWNERTGTLSFGISGYHYAPDGSVYPGRAEVFVPGPLARCMWKVDPRRAARMEIEVYTQNGEEAAGTKAISYDEQADVVKLIAENFTYSQKQIAARPTPFGANPGKKACDAANVVCVTVDRARRTARVSVVRAPGDAAEVLAVALQGTRESGAPIKARVSKGKATMTVKLAGAKSAGQVWVVRTPTAFISGFRVG